MLTINVDDSRVRFALFATMTNPSLKLSWKMAQMENSEPIDKNTCIELFKAELQRLVDVDRIRNFETNQVQHKENETEANKSKKKGVSGFVEYENTEKEKTTGNDDGEFDLNIDMEVNQS